MLNKVALFLLFSYSFLEISKKSNIHFKILFFSSILLFDIPVCVDSREEMHQRKQAWKFREVADSQS